MLLFVVLLWVVFLCVVLIWVVLLCVVLRVQFFLCSSDGKTAQGTGSKREDESNEDRTRGEREEAAGETGEHQGQGGNQETENHQETQEVGLTVIT